MKIVVIDDDSAMSELIKILLLPITPDVVTLTSEPEKINSLKAIQPDIVLLNLMAPAINGCEVCKKIREFSNTPILVLSALDSPQLIADSLDAGADDYLIKPVGSNILIAHINKLVRRNKSIANMFAI